MTKPPLWEVANDMYHIVAELMPQYIQDNPDYLAAACGFLGAYAVTRGIQSFSGLGERLIEGFETKVLPVLETLVAFGIPAVVVGSAIGDRDSVIEVMSNNPTYSSGMASAYLGGLLAVFENAIDRNMNPGVE